MSWQEGNAYIRIDAEAKVTGTAVYTDDVYLPGMYYCKLVQPYAHALIKSIDFSEAPKVPGVRRSDRRLPRVTTSATPRRSRSWPIKSLCAAKRCAW